MCIRDSLGTGLVLCVLESYWQPKFLGLLKASEAGSALLGVLSLFYMTSAAGGNLLSERLVRSGRLGLRPVFIGARLGMLCFVILSAVSVRSSLFAVFYCLLYFCFGISNIAENTIVNAAIPDENRASLLSLQSFVLQLGAVFAALGSSLLELRSIGTLWLLASGLAFALLLPSVKTQCACLPEKNADPVR